MKSIEEQVLDFVSEKLIELGQKQEGGFIVIDICPKCGKITVTTCKHNSCYNNQCECGYLSGFIGRNHAN